MEIYFKKYRNYDRSFFMMMLLMNTAAFISGVVWQITGTGSVLWNIVGFLMLITFTGNIIASYLARDHKWSGYLYLVLSAVSMLMIFNMNSRASADPENQISRSTASAILIFSLFMMGAVISAGNINSGLNRRYPPYVRKSRSRVIIGKIARCFLALLLIALLCTGLMVAYMILEPNSPSTFEVVFPTYSLFYAFAFLSLGVMILKLLDINRIRLLNTIVLILTLIIFAVCILPFASTPVLLANAQKNYSAAFGNEYLTNRIFGNEHFRQIRFSIPEYFYGTRSRPYNIQQNVLFYKGPEGVDNGIELYFDVYTPKADAGTLPGENSVLIRLHGGGWVAGDKGEANYAQMNKYFAGQGYVVFDIQYGLTKLHPEYDAQKMKADRYGDFTINDMVRHIGKFTVYLAENSEKYNANIESVFFSGHSAGGNLALASGLGLASGMYADILDSRIKVKGFIPFYPANEIPRNYEFGGSEGFVYPGTLVSSDTPPCLIFQGSHDGIVSPRIAERFRTAYLEKDNRKCAILLMPFGDHSADMYFSGFYNQTFLYYMERFMAHFR